MECLRIKIKTKIQSKILKSGIIQISTKNMEHRKHSPGNGNSAIKVEP